MTRRGRDRAACAGEAARQQVRGEAGAADLRVRAARQTLTFAARGHSSPLEDVLHTLLHEMVHQWQQESGLAVAHDRAFRANARAVGIDPRAVLRDPRTLS